ncbi:TIGR01244 family sulfur transferase [Pseudochrobactrum sp. MP213Fo]|uniref:TIGR01244 family sulfur transferase n=1 Tax=Pseudochrobactrum sp. MP213Fo TaxID=3022250 RepID=UPI003BA20078
MEIRPIDENFAVTGQLTPEDVSLAAAAGYKTLICNRPDHESDGQPEYAAIAKAAENAGLKIYFIPVVGGQMTQTNVDEMAQALADAPAPVLAYCRSGTRCTNLYGIVQQQKQG